MTMMVLERVRCGRLCRTRCARREWCWTTRAVASAGGGTTIRTVATCYKTQFIARNHNERDAHQLASRGLALRKGAPGAPRPKLHDQQRPRCIQMHRIQLTTEPRSPCCGKACFQIRIVDQLRVYDANLCQQNYLDPTHLPLDGRIRIRTLRDEAPGHLRLRIIRQQREPFSITKLNF